MRKTLIYIKVVLLLTAFVGVSSSHAAKSGNHDILASCVCDLGASLGEQSSSGDEKAVLIELALPFSLTLISPAYQSPQLTLLGSSVRTPFARAPPVSISA